MASVRDKESSPFTPGSPAQPEMFVGRSAQIEELLRYARQACSNRQENVFLAGDRGIGKSSLAVFVRELCASQLNMLGVHVVLTEATTLEELVRRVFEQVLKVAHTQPWFEKVKSFFGSFVKEIGLFGISIEFAPPAEHLRTLIHQFPQALKAVLQKMREQKRGLLMVWDDINGLAGKAEFANWYKATVEHIALNERDFPLLLMMCGLPERRDTLAHLQPSLMRVFRVVEIDRLDDGEVKQFFQHAFGKASTKVERDALDVMAEFSSGLPTLMHEIGDATYWSDTDGVIDTKDGLAGIVAAAEAVGRKYLDPKVYRAIRSERYRTILAKLLTEPTAEAFDKREVEQRLDGAEKKVFHNFLQKMKELGVIEVDRERHKGAYRFANRIFPIYIFMQSNAVRRTASGRAAGTASP